MITISIWISIALSTHINSGLEIILLERLLNLKWLILGLGHICEHSTLNKASWLLHGLWLLHSHHSSSKLIRLLHLSCHHICSIRIHLLLHHHLLHQHLLLHHWVCIHLLSVINLTHRIWNESIIINNT